MTNNLWIKCLKNRYKDQIYTTFSHTTSYHLHHHFILKLNSLETTILYVWETLEIELLCFPNMPALTTWKGKIYTACMLSTSQKKCNTFTPYELASMLFFQLMILQWKYSIINCIWMHYFIILQTKWAVLEGEKEMFAVKQSLFWCSLVITLNIQNIVWL